MGSKKHTLCQDSELRKTSLPLAPLNPLDFSFLKNTFIYCLSPLPPFPSVLPLALQLYVNCPSLLCLPCPFLPTSLISFSLFLSLYLFYLISFYITVFFILFLFLGRLMGFYFQFPKLAVFCIAHSII